MEKERLLSLGAGVVCLARAALHKTPIQKEELLRMDLCGIQKMAGYHSMDAIVYLSLKEAAEASDGEILEKIDTNVYKKLENAYRNSVRRLIAFDCEREQILSFFKEKGAWYLCLKGIVLQEYYPKLGMRQMADNDILFDKKYAAALRSFMQSRGYKTLSYGKGCHDMYGKGDLIFELHRSLLPEKKSNAGIIAALREILEQTARGASSLERRFSKENFYIYFILHTHKHFEIAGCGLRSLMDIYVYTKKHESDLDFAYIDAFFSHIGLSDFEKRLRSLANRLFEKNDESADAMLSSLSKDERALLLFLSGSGTFGTEQTHMKNDLLRLSKNEDITARAKFKYLLERVFPPFSYYKAAHPRLYKWIVPIPFLWALRLLGAISKRARISRELENLRNAGETDKNKE